MNERLASMGQPVLPTFVAPRRERQRRPRAVRALPAPADDAEAPQPVPQLELLAAAEARPCRRCSVRRARRRRCRLTRTCPTATSPRCSTTVRRSSLPVRVGERVPPRCGGDPVRLVDVAAPRRPGGQRADERHAHRLGRRRRLLRHARRGPQSAQRVAAASRVRPAGRPATVTLVGYGSRPHLRIQGDAAAPARRRRGDHRPDPGHRRRPRPARLPAAGRRLRRREPATADLRQRQPDRQPRPATAPGCAAGTSTSTRSTRSRARC